MKVRKWLCGALAAVMLLCLLGCSANGASMDAMTSKGENFYDVEDSMVVEATMAPEAGSTALPEGRKWIITVDMRVETEDLDTLLSQLSAQVAQLQGYLENQNIYNGSAYANRRYRSASLTIRIPAQQVDAFTEQVGGISNIISKNQQLDDVTLAYVDTESRMNALKAEEERLLDLMTQAETMADLLEIESRLTDVRYALESVTSQLRLYDNLVDYATINLSIEEVQEYTPVEEETLWQRISGGFVDSLKGLGTFFLELMVFLIVNLPYLLVFGGVIWLIVFLCRRAAKKRRANTPPPRPPYPMPPYPPTQDQNRTEG